MSSNESFMTSGILWVERFYTHFIGRDFAYTFAGGLFICIVEYAWYNKIFLPQQPSLELIAFLSASYFLGLALRDIPTILDSSFTFDTKKEIHLLQELIENNYDMTIPSPPLYQ